MDPNKQQILPSWLFSCDISDSRSDLCLDLFCIQDDESKECITIAKYHDYIRQIDNLKEFIILKIDELDVKVVDEKITYKEFIENRQIVADTAYNKFIEDKDNCLQKYLKKYYDKHIKDKMIKYYRDKFSLFPERNPDYMDKLFHNIFRSDFDISYCQLAPNNCTFNIDNNIYKFNGSEFIKSDVKEPTNEYVLSMDQKNIIESVFKELYSYRVNKYPYIDIMTFMLFYLDKIKMKYSFWLTYFNPKKLPDDYKIINNIIYDKRYFIRALITTIIVLTVFVLVLLYLFK